MRLSKPKTRFAFAATDRTWDFHERSHERVTPRCSCEETFINGIELMLYEQVAAALDLVINYYNSLNRGKDVVLRSL